MNPLANAMSNSSGINAAVSDAAKLLSGKDPDAVARVLCNTNPQFREFYTRNRGKSVQQICSENGIDPNILQMFRK